MVLLGIKLEILVLVAQCIYACTHKLFAKISFTVLLMVIDACLAEVIYKTDKECLFVLSFYLFLQFFWNHRILSFVTRTQAQSWFALTI